MSGILKLQSYTGALFTVSAENKKPNGPDLTGNVNLDKNDRKNTVRIAAFIKPMKEEGKKFYSLSVGSTKEESLSGALFKNDRKTADNQPDYTGTLDLDKDGTQKLRVAGWIRPGKDGAEDWVSLSFEVPQAKEAQAAA